jgi:S1-C subfamily serine protease
VTGILRGGPADKGGLQPGDVIVSMNGEKITEGRQALNLIAQHKPGQTISLQIIRDGKTLTRKATTIERPTQAE